MKSMNDSSRLGSRRGSFGLAMMMAVGAFLPLAACGDDDAPAATTSGAGAGPGSSSSSSSGAGASSSSSSGNGGGGSAPFETPTPMAIELSAEGPDQIQSIASAGNGDFYAAGYAAEAVGEDGIVTVVKFSATGLDANFGDAGIASTGVVFTPGAADLPSGNNGTDEIDVTVQTSGRILVSATVADEVPTDRDIVVIGLLPSGDLDPDFGEGGVARVDLNTSVSDATRDRARAITVDDDDNIFVHAISRGPDAATDTDFTVVKLLPDGDVDEENFGVDGEFRLDVFDANVNATVRGIKALPDGSIIAGGYTQGVPDVETNQPVLYKLTPEGELDTNFNDIGYIHQEFWVGATEIYNFAVHGTHIVTGGYGYNTVDESPTNWASLRIAIADGAQDTTWGGTGVLEVDPSGSMLGSNCRNAIGLPGGKTILIGSTGPSNMPAQDAVFAVLDADGGLDSAYGDGIHVLPFGTDGNDAFWGGAVSGDFVALGGFKGGGLPADQNETTNDDAFVVVFEIQ
jgi:uncharacterized delta-60 repeat protein